MEQSNGTKLIISIDESDVYVETTGEPRYNFAEIAGIHVHNELGTSFPERLTIETSKIDFTQPQDCMVVVSAREDDGNYRQSTFALHIVEPDTDTSGNQLSNRQNIFNYIYTKLLQHKSMTLLTIFLFALLLIFVTTTMLSNPMGSSNMNMQKVDIADKPTSVNHALNNLINNLSIATEDYQSNKDNTIYQGKLSQAQKSSENIQTYISSSNQSLKVEVLATRLVYLKQSIRKLQAAETPRSAEKIYHNRYATFKYKFNYLLQEPLIAI